MSVVTIIQTMLVLFICGYNSGPAGTSDINFQIRHWKEENLYVPNVRA